MDPEVGDFILAYVVREVTGLHQVAAVIVHQEECADNVDVSFMISYHLFFFFLTTTL